MLGLCLCSHVVIYIRASRFQVCNSCCICSFFFVSLDSGCLGLEIHVSVLFKLFGVFRHPHSWESAAACHRLLPRSDLDKSGSSHGQGMLDFNEFLEIMTVPRCAWRWKHPTSKELQRCTYLC